MLLVYYSIMSMVISSREKNLQALLTSDKRKRPRNLSRTSVAVETLVLGGWWGMGLWCKRMQLGKWNEKQCDLVDKVDRNPTVTKLTCCFNSMDIASCFMKMTHPLYDALQKVYELERGIETRLKLDAWSSNLCLYCPNLWSALVSTCCDSFAKHLRVLPQSSCPLKASLESSQAELQ